MATTGGRSVRQDEIWNRLTDIRAMYDPGVGCLLDPEDDGCYQGDDLVAIQTEYTALCLEYVAIHLANGTRG